MCRSLDETKALANKLADEFKAGDVVELVGDIGTGKTTFVKYLAEALGSDDHVSSPTFTIANEYQAKDLMIYHCDFYRLGDDDFLIKQQLAEMTDKDSLVLLEWSENLGIDLGATIKIFISVNADDLRNFTVEGLDK